jgi:Domain of unknown function (DUF397)
MTWIRNSHCQDGECTEVRWHKASASTISSHCVEVAWHKASASTYNGGCVEVAWRKALASHANGNYVEAGTGECGMVHVRDSKDPDGPRLNVAPGSWRAFLTGMKAGEFGGIA